MQDRLGCLVLQYVTKRLEEIGTSLQEAASELVISSPEKEVVSKYLYKFLFGQG